MPLSPHSLSPIYNSLINLLHPSPPLSQILELDILPSSYPSTLYSSPPSLALPKPLLASLFVTAHAEFFTHITSRKRSYRSIEDEGIQERLGDGGSPTDESSQSGDGSRYIAALRATRVLLLWDPNHITAANFRKRHLLSCSQSREATIPNCSQSTTYAPADPAATFRSLLHSELSFLTSLFTSPLPKAPKASTLWANRLWLLRSFLEDVLVLSQQEQVNRTEPEVDFPGKSADEGADANPEAKSAVMGSKSLQKGEASLSSTKSALQDLYTIELQIVMRAADRHPRNFYAWGYARALFTYLINLSFTPSPSPNKETPPNNSPILSISLALSALPRTHSWCMTHPRDISGWTFLVFLIQQLELGPGPGPGPNPEPRPEPEPSLKYPLAAGTGFIGEVLAAGDVHLDRDTQGAARAARKEVNRILSATIEAAERFHWRGESVRWFLKSVGGGVGEMGREGDGAGVGNVEGVG